MNTRHVIALLASVALVGCTSMQPLNSTPAELADIADAGDHLIVYEKSGRITDMTLVAINDERIHGTYADSGNAVNVPFADIEHIEIERVDGTRTVLAVVGTSVVVAILAVAVAGVGAAAILASSP